MDQSISILRVVGWYFSFLFKFYKEPWADQKGGGGDRGSGPPLKNHKNIGFLCNTGLDPLKNHKAAKPAFYDGPTLAHKGNTIKMAFRWRADDGPFIVVFGSSIPSTT